MKIVRIAYIVPTLFVISLIKINPYILFHDRKQVAESTIYLNEGAFTPRCNACFFILYPRLGLMTKVILHTNIGDIEITLHKDMPITTSNFTKLVNEGFYNNIIFHRVINGFMIQGGCPEGTGMGGPGYNIQDEFGKGHSNVRGTISMANTGRPNTGGSQFFINTVDNKYLDKENLSTPYAHPVFGQITKGMDVVDKIEKVPTDGNDRPLSPIVIQKAEVKE